MGMDTLSNSDLKLLILEIFAKSHQSMARMMSWVSHTRRAACSEVNTTFTSDQRNRARKALEELKERDFIRPTMSDTMVPDD